ncbi:nucleoporin FG repeat-containing protein [Rhodotorula paludigena]|uniref:nucleoporin FG repeat-containing protein n=1 Tax=Rhodotorula paludigena TaxID=86838 RepID=UPI003182710F
MSLFGTSSAPSFSFGTSAAAPASSAPAPSLFGAPAPAAGTSAAPAASGGLFGASNPAATTSAAPSLFGAPAASSTPAPAAGGGLFGSTAASTAPGAAPKPTFSFGAPAASTSTAPSLFGTPAPAGGAAAPAPAAGGGLFGASSAAPASGGLFGAKPATTGPAPATGGLFGSTAGTSAAAPALGASTAAPAAGAITRTTKYNDLPDAARNVIDEMDKFIRSQCQLADELKAKELGTDIIQTQRLFEQYSSDASSVASLLQTDSRLLSTLRADLEQSLSDLTKATTLIEGFKAPQSPKAAEAKALATFPFEFFRRKTDEMKDRAGRYKATMDQIASLLSSPSSTLSPSSLVPTLKAQHASLVSLASAVSALDLELKQLKDEYRAIYREKTGRTSDPFRVNGSGAAVGAGSGLEKSVGGLALR